MAGSYSHCVDDEGRLLGNEDLLRMLENGGDVYEAIKEMYGMIWYLASGVAAHVPDGPMEEAMPAVVSKAQRMHGFGLTISPGVSDD